MYRYVVWKQKLLVRLSNKFGCQSLLIKRGPSSQQIAELNLPYWLYFLLLWQLNNMRQQCNTEMQSMAEELSRLQVASFYPA